MEHVETVYEGQETRAGANESRGEAVGACRRAELGLQWPFVECNIIRVYVLSLHLCSQYRLACDL